MELTLGPLKRPFSTNQIYSHEASFSFVRIWYSITSTKATRTKKEFASRKQIRLVKNGLGIAGIEPSHCDYSAVFQLPTESRTAGSIAFFAPG
jgi:hypothetical protein